MHWRTFLGSLATLLIPFRKSRAAPKVVHPLYGEYVSHHCSNNIRHMELCLDDLKYPPVSKTASSYFRYVDFPIETTLVIRLGKSEFLYMAFNASQQLCDEINQMSPTEIVRVLSLDVETEAHDIEFIDKGSIVKEQYPDAITVQDSGPRKVKFRLTSVVLRGE